MKKIIIVTILMFASVNSLAAESSPYDGSYIGIHMGYAKGDLNGADIYTDPGNPQFTATNTFKSAMSDYLWGGLLGYNKVIGDNFLLGIEGDYEQRNSQNKTNLVDNQGNIQLFSTAETKIGKASSLRVRVGKVFNQDKTLAYFTAGYALAEIKTSYAIENVSPFSRKNWQSGYTAGLGMEHFFTDSLSFKTEYRFSDYGKKDIDPTADTGTPGSIERTKYENEHSIRLGLMYHF